MNYLFFLPGEDIELSLRLSSSGKVRAKDYMTELSFGDQTNVQKMKIMKQMPIGKMVMTDGFMQDCHRNSTS